MATKVFPYIIVFFSMFSGSFLMAQEMSTLDRVKMLNKNKRYSQSLRLLGDYQRKHKQELYGDWLLAQTLHLNGDFNLSQRKYYDLESRHPYNYDIKIDRINKVIDEGRLGQAITQLHKIKRSLPKYYNFLAHKMLAEVHYWRGDYDEASEEVDRALYIYNTEKSALALKKTIQKARSNWLIVGLDYFNDDQPLNIFTPSVEGAVYLNTKMSVGAKILYPIYNHDDISNTTPWLTLFSRFNFIEQAMTLNVGAGYIGYRDDQSITGFVNLKKKIARYASLSAGVDFAPYLATTYVVPNKLMQTKYQVSFDYNKPKSFIGQASYTLNQFSAIDNSYFTLGAWLMSPPYELDAFELRGGYGVSYSDGKESTFRATKDVSEIKNEDIEGVYDPFYSPNNQLINSLVGLAKYNISEVSTIGLDIDFGFYAVMQAPYLYLDRNDKGKKYVARDFGKSTYHPMGLKVHWDYSVTEDISLKLFYKYQKTYYYKSNKVGLSVGFMF